MEVRAMNELQFVVGTFGAFDYTAPGRAFEASSLRLIGAYEFEFYVEDYPGGQYNAGLFCPAKRNFCTLAKPGQRQQVVRPMKGYYLNIHTQDPRLCDLLEQLPNSFPLWDMTEVVKLMEQMIATKGRDTLSGQLIRQGCVCRIFAVLCDYVQLPANLTKIPVQHQQTLLSADRFIRDHFCEDISLETLAQKFGLDKTYFHKLYVATFGKTPAQRILALRIGAAKQGLLEDKLSMAELAARCGFSSQSYFCYKFKQVVGVPPSQYRQTVYKQIKK